MRVEEPKSAFEMESLSLDQKHLLIAQRNADLYAAELNRAAQGLAESHLLLGNHSEALAAAAICGNDEVEAAVAAIERDDEDRCGCTHEVEITLPNKKTEMRAATNYLTWGRVWSPKHNAMVNISRCFQCGHMQAIPGHIDELHETVANAVTENQAQAQRSLGTGQRADLKSDHHILPDAGPKS